MQLPTRSIRARAPFDLRRTLSFACSFSPMRGEQEVGDGRWAKALIVDGHPVAVRLSRSDAGDPCALSLEISSARPLEVRVLDRIEARVRFVLSLDEDLGPFAARASEDRALAPIARALHGFHHPKFPSAHEIACWAVLGQRTPIGLAREQKRAITERFGAAVEHVEHEGRVLRAFPDARTLAAVPERELGLPIAKKAAAIAVISRELAALGDPDAALRAMPFAEAEEWLGALPMIGAWSTAFVLFRGLGRMERATLEGPLLACARRVYGARASVAELARIAEGYGEHVGTWALYLRAGAGEGSRALGDRAA